MHRFKPSTTALGKTLLPWNVVAVKKELFDDTHLRSPDGHDTGLFESVARISPSPEPRRCWSLDSTDYKPVEGRWWGEGGAAGRVYVFTHGDIKVERSCATLVPLHGRVPTVGAASATPFGIAEIWHIYRWRVEVRVEVRADGSDGWSAPPPGVMAAVLLRQYGLHRERAGSWDTDGTREPQTFGSVFPPNNNTKRMSKHR